MHRTKRVSSWLFGAMLVALLLGARPAAAQWSPPQVGPIWRLLGFHFNLVGRDLNGVSFNGKVLDGLSVTSVSLDGVQLAGKQLKQVKLSKTRFSGGGSSGKDFIGAEFQATLSDGSTLPLRVDHMERHPDPRHKDVYLYEVYYTGAGGQLAPLCGYDDQGQPLRAIPLNGRWDQRQGVPGGGDWIEDPSAFTFACEGYVIAKCVLAGYKPWRKVQVCIKGQGCTVTTLADHHQACTRMLRAEYCGDGTPHTHDNVQVNLYDGIGIRSDSEPWTFEAEWDAKGALCVSETRLQLARPACAAQLQDPSCGDPQNFFRLDDNAALLMSEHQPAQ